MTPRQQIVESTAKRIVEESKVFKKQRRQKTSQDFLEGLKNTRQVVLVKTLNPGEYFSFAYEDDKPLTDRRKGRKEYTTAMGTTVTIFMHIEGYEDMATLVPTQKVVISSAVKVRKLKP